MLHRRKAKVFAKWLEHATRCRAVKRMMKRALGAHCITDDEEGRLNKNDEIIF